jgi:signal transduction histidine kinase
MRQHSKLISLSHLSGFLHPSLSGNDEELRRGLLQIRCGVLGGVLALIYATLFLILGHLPGALILGLCGVAIVQVPWILRKTGNLSLGSHIYGGVLLLGISSMCVADGGGNNSMFAWIAVVPVCALLLMHLKDALWWCAVTVVVAASFLYFEMKGVSLLTLSLTEKNPGIAVASSAGLVLFLGFLAALFEKNGMEASARFHQAKDELTIANQELIDLNRQKNEFLNIAAHDLKNPLSIICGYADLLREIESPTLLDIRNQASEILRSGNHMLDIISNILDVRSIEDGQRRMKRVECPVITLLESVISDYRPAAGRKEIQLINEVKGEDGPVAYADPQTMRQVSDNLISNAIKYTPAGGVVRISTCTTETGVSISIADTGPGLSEADQKKLWNKFTRLTPRPTGNEQSTGLGLWIVRQLVKDMGGDVFCVSAPGKGSTFGFTVPLWNGEIHTDTETESSPRNAALHHSERSAFDRLLADIEEKTKLSADERGPLTADKTDDVALPG